MNTSIRRFTCRLSCIVLFGSVTAFAQSATPVDFQRNLQWAQSGQVPAELTVAKDYLRGAVVRRNFTTSRTWFQTAADAGSMEAKAMLGSMMIAGRGGAKDVAGGLALVRAGVSKDDPTSKTILGMELEGGKRVPQDLAKAANLYKEAAKAGDAHAMTLLAVMYRRGDATPADAGEPMRLLQAAITLGNEWGQVELGDELATGRYGATEPGTALKLYQAAAAQNNRVAYFRLGGMYEHGNVVEKDFKIAEHYYHLAALQDYPPAEAAEAAMYDLGLAVTADKSRAYVWAALAGRQGDFVGRQRMNILQAELTPAQLAAAQTSIAAFISTNGDPMVAK